MEQLHRSALLENWPEKSVPNSANTSANNDLPLLLARCDRVGVLYRGRLVDVAPAAHLARVARHPYTRRLLAAFPSPGPSPSLPSDFEGRASRNASMYAR